MLINNNSTKKSSIEPSNNSALYSVKIATSKDAQEICELFKKVFKEEMTLDHWHWKYDRDLSRSIVVYKGNNLVAHYGGVGTDMLLEGSKSKAIQVTDLMVDPQVRNSIRSNSPFYLSAKKFLDSFVGDDKPFLLGYGFPSERAMALSEKLQLFTSVGHMCEVQWSVIKTEKTITGKVIELNKDNYSSFEKKINQLWKSFRKNLSKNFVCTKNADYFRWRFLDHPSKQYSIYLVLGVYTGLPKAMIVLRHDKHESMLMDMIGNSFDLEKLVGLALNLCEKSGAKKLKSWHSNNFSSLFSVCSATQKSLPIIIPANKGSKGPSPESQKNKWWLMPGDTDYL